MAEPNTSSKYSGYLSRAEPYISQPESFNPQRSLLELAVLRNAQTEHEGITLVLFSDRTIVDASGKLSILTQEDFDGITALAQQTRTLPKSDHLFRNQWRVKNARTGRPIDRILAVRSKLSDIPAENYQHEYEETSVYGFNKDLTILEKPVSNFTELAPSLYELTGLALEARAPGPSDESVLSKVRIILGNVF